MSSIKIKSSAGASLQCNNLDEFLSFQKKLSQSWSAWSGSRLFTPPLLEDLSANFDTLDKKVKMRVLISLIGLDVKKRQEFSKQIKHLLRVAHESSDHGGSENWVAVIAGIISERLFGDDTELDSSSVCHGAKSTLIEAVDKLMLRFLDSNSDMNVAITNRTHVMDDEEDLESLIAFQPIECQYMAPYEQKTENDSTKSINTHFTFTGTTPSILERDLLRQAKNTISMPSANVSASSSKNNTSEHRSEKASVAGLVADRKPSFLVQAKMTRAPAVLLSLDELKAVGPGVRAITAPSLKEEKKEKKIPVVKEPKEKKVKEPKGKKVLSGEEGVTPSKNEILDNANEEKVVNEISADPVSDILAMPQNVESSEPQNDGPLEPALPLQTDNDAETHTPITGKRKLADEQSDNHPVQPKAAIAEDIPYNLPLELPLLKDNSPQLSAEDSVILDKFFADDWKIHFPDSDTLPERRVLLKEVEAVDTNTSKVVGKALYYLVLNFQNHSWMRSNKYKAKKGSK